MTTDDKPQGFAPGKRVWLKDTWEGTVLARRLGEYADGMKVGPRGDKPDPYGRLEVSLGDGTPYPIRRDWLRLTPPPGLTQKRQSTKKSEPKPRKEAIDPEFGDELSLLDLPEVAG